MGMTEMLGRGHRQGRAVVGAAIAGALLLAGCSNKTATTTGTSSSPGGPSSSTASSAATAAASSAAATPTSGGKAVSASCSTVSGAEVSSALGHSYANGVVNPGSTAVPSPAAGASGQTTIASCIYEDSAEVAAGMPPLFAPSRVIITYGSGASAATMAAGKSQVAQYKNETATDVSGVGDEAFTISTTSNNVADLIARKGSTEVSVQVTAPTGAPSTTQLAALVNQILGRL